jgi:hypothetical protein
VLAGPHLSQSVCRGRPKILILIVEQGSDRVGDLDRTKVTQMSGRVCSHHRVFQGQSQKPNVSLLRRLSKLEDQRVSRIVRAEKTLLNPTDRQLRRVAAHRS